MFTMMSRKSYHPPLSCGSLNCKYKKCLQCRDTVRLQLHGVIYHPDSFVLMLRYCANLKAIRYESTSLNRTAADKSQHVIVA